MSSSKPGSWAATDRSALSAKEAPSNTSSSCPPTWFEIDQRQPALGDAGDRDGKPEIVLVARIRRAVRHQQDFRAGLGEALDDVLVVLGFFEPDVLADGHADAHALHRHRARGGPAREQALFVEHAVVRQIRLVAKRCDAPAIEQRAGVVELALLDPGRADQHGRSAIGGLARQRLDRFAAGGLERRLQHEIFRRIAGDEQFGQQQEVGAVGFRRLTRSPGLGGIAGDVAHGRVELGQRDPEFGGLGHEPDVALHKSKLQTVVLDRAHAFGDGKQPKHSAIRSATPTAAEPMSLTRPICGSWSVVSRSASFSIAVLSSSTTSTKRHGRDQLHPAHHGGADQPGQRDRQREREQLLAHGLLRADREGEPVTRVDGGSPQSQQITVPLRPASAPPCPRAPA